MRKFVVVVAVTAGAACAVPVAADASTTVAVSGVVNLDWGTKTRPPASCAGLTCGSGNLRPFGQTTWTNTESNYTNADAMTLTTWVGQLYATGSGANATTPGNSAGAPGAAVSYGNPVCFSYDLTVVGGNGALAGATGTLPGAVCIDGASVQWKGSGTLTVG